MKTSKWCLGLLMCLACDPTATNTHPRDPKEPKFVERDLGVSPQDDLILVVNSGWHDGKDIPLTQHLHPNSSTLK